jgi:two-component system, NtrC family, sensor histidine kinase KinB
VQDSSIRKEAEKLKAEVVAMVSHDLRSPLSSLLVSFDMMGQGFAGEFNDEDKELIGQTRNSIVSLMALINDLIDAEKFDSNSYVPHLEIVRIKSVLTDILGRENDDAKWKGLQIQLNSEDLDIRADEEKIANVIKTFLINAIRRSPQGAPLVVSCRRVEANQLPKGMVEVRVEDQGKPFTEEQRRQVFERFSTTSSAAASLRFVLCRAIIEAHDGEIGIESTEEGATALWFRIPLQ